MRRTRISSLVLAAAFVTAAAWAVIRALSSRGVLLPAVPWGTVLVLVLIAGVVLWLGWTVRQYLHGKHPDLHPLRAARTAVLAKASCYAGALLAGWYLAQLLHTVTALTDVPMRERAWSAGLAVAGSVVLAVAGLVAEWLCRVPPPEDPKEQDPVLDPAAT